MKQKKGATLPGWFRTDSEHFGDELPLLFMTHTSHWATIIPRLCFQWIAGVQEGYIKKKAKQVVCSKELLKQCGNNSNFT